MSRASGELTNKKRDRLPSYEQRGIGENSIRREREILKSKGKHWSPLLGMCHKGEVAVRGGKEPHRKRIQDTSLVSFLTMFANTRKAFGCQGGKLAWNKK